MKLGKYPISVCYKVPPAGKHYYIHILVRLIQKGSENRNYRRLGNLCRIVYSVRISHVSVQLA